MTPDKHHNPCDAFADELLRLCCGDDEHPSPALTEHLDACPRCQAAFDQTADLVGTVRELVEPEPLTAETTQRIRAAFDPRVTHRATYRLWSLRLAGMAVAACLLFALAWPGTSTDTARVTASTNGGIALSADDAAVIVAAYSQFAWEGPTEYSVELLEEQVDDVTQQVQRRAKAESYLPWDSDDDWDLPASNETDTSAAPSPAVAVAARTVPLRL